MIVTLGCDGVSRSRCEARGIGLHSGGVECKAGG